MFEIKERYNIYDLLQIMEVLRSENGCPWDIEQTHESIRTNIIEEAYEVCEAIDCSSPDMLKEELGDLLLQVTFHTQIEREAGNFTFDDVCNDICQKLVYRHPHVFGEVKVSGSEDVLKNWDALKKESKHQQNYSETLESVPKNFPALLRGEKICKRASRAGLPINSAEEYIARIHSGLDSLKLSENEEIHSQNQQILGDTLLDICNLSRILDIDSEKALTYSTNKFIILFRALEEELLAQGKKPDECSDEELGRLMKKVFSGQ